MSMLDTVRAPDQQFNGRNSAFYGRLFACLKIWGSNFEHFAIEIISNWLPYASARMPFLFNFNYDEKGLLGNPESVQR